MKKIGDDLVNDRLLNQWFSKVILHANLNQLNIGEVLLPIAEEILKGGINWGRIVMVIYLVYKLTIKEIDVTSLIFGIIKWVVQYLYKKLGGWVSSFFHNINVLLRYLLVLFVGISYGKKRSNYKDFLFYASPYLIAQQTNECSKSTIDTLGKGEIFSKLTKKTPGRSQ